jgi:hypothetical protein
MPEWIPSPGYGRTAARIEGLSSWSASRSLLFGALPQEIESL